MIHVRTQKNMWNVIKCEISKRKSRNVACAVLFAKSVPEMSRRCPGGVPEVSRRCPGGSPEGDLAPDHCFFQRGNNLFNFNKKNTSTTKLTKTYKSIHHTAFHHANININDQWSMINNQLQHSTINHPTINFNNQRSNPLHHIKSRPKTALQQPDTDTTCLSSHHVDHINVENCGCPVAAETEPF